MQASPKTQVILVYDFVGRGMSCRIRSLRPSARVTVEAREVGHFRCNFAGHPPFEMWRNQLCLPVAEAVSAAVAPTG